jgi:PAS domain S-box-containing protein
VTGRSEPLTEPRANVLLVDDRPADLLALEALLADLGHSLVQAPSGEKALRLLRDQDFAVILLGVPKHGPDGFETAQRIRAQERSRCTPILFLADPDDDRLSAEQAYALGAVDHLVKPLVPVILRAKVAGFVELFQKTEQVRRQAEQLRHLERREFERRLAEENARFRALTEHSSDAVSLIRADGTVLYNSPSSRRVLGYEPDEFVGRSGFEVVHPDDRQRIAARLADLAREPRTPVTEELRVRHKDGSWRWVECVGTNLLAEPAVRAVVINFRDITERHRATEALRDSEQRFARFMQHLPGLAWIKDAQGRYVYANDAAVRAFRTSRAALYGRTDAEVFPPATAAQFAENDRRALAGGAGVQVVETLQHEDGVLHHSLVSKFPIPGPDGTAAVVGGMAIDITEQRRTQAVLEESELRFRQLAENIKEVFWVSDPDKNEVLYVSPAYEEVWGRSCRSLYERPRSFLDAVHPDDRERVLALSLARQVRGELADVEYRVVRPDGSVRWVRDRGFPIRDPSGEVYRIVGLAEDITERKRAEESLREADRRKDEFLAMLAHELRNPLAPIRNAVELIKLLAPEEPNLRRARDLIERQVVHLARLVDDLLDVSRITRGKIKLHKEPLELGGVLARAVEASRPLVEARGHQLTVSLPRDPVPLLGDATRLAQVFSNLLSNAAKYTEEGGRIEVVAEAAGGEAVVRVRDTGVGIPADLMPQVFDLFTQGDRSLARSEGGLGIGLTLVKSLVEMHGGRVELFSGGPGEGTEARVRLPALEVRRAAGPGGAEPGPTGAGAPTRRVLLVDDHADTAESLAMVLKAEGHEVRTAPDGATALEVAGAYRPEVVLLDIGLPRMDGYEVARRLRAQAGPTRVLLIALTGYGQEEDRRRAAAAGFDAHLVKPADLTTLRALLGERKGDPS